MKIYTLVECENRNSQRLLNKFIEKNIVVKKLSQHKEKLRFFIEEKDFKSVQSILNSMGLGFEIKRRGGSFFAKKFFLRYVSLIVASIIALVISGMGSRYCFGVQIECENNEVKSQVNAILDEYSVKNFMLKSSLDTKALSKDISNKIEEAGFVNCFFDGSILKIQIKQVHTDEEKPEYSRIVASCDGIVTRVLVYSGTALVKAGDVVKKGDVLIEGYIDTYPDTEENQRIPVEADGVVYAECAYSQRATISDKSIEEVRTGKSYKSTDLYVFGRLLGKKSKPSYEYYESVTETKVFGSVIPVKAVTTTYYEIEKRETTLTQSQIDEQITLYEMQVWQTLPEEAKLLKNYTLRKRVDNLYIIDIYYIVEQSICQGV